jgi:predicted O-methyltransferase YrrM
MLSDGNSMDAIKRMRPLVTHYDAGEQFAISTEGLRAWRQSEAFERIFASYRDYPSRSVMSDESRALLHHLILMRRPERVLEIGTYNAGTTEVMARALWEAGHGHIETIDPFGGERCPPILATYPPKLQERISFYPVSSAAHVDQALSRNTSYDMVLIDGNHEFEFALFDLLCTARLIRPGGLVVLDNVDQMGPRYATKLFLQENPQWRDIADVVRLIDPAAPFSKVIPSFPDTAFYLLEAPPHFLVRQMPRSFGSAEVDRAEVEGIELDLAGPVQGKLHVHVYARTFGLLHPEELQCQQSFDLDFPEVPTDPRIRLSFDNQLHTEYPQGGLVRRVEISLAFMGKGAMALRSPPLPWPARHGASLEA